MDPREIENPIAERDFRYQLKLNTLQKDLSAMTADRDRFAKLSEEWALKGVRMSHKIMDLSADRDRWKGICNNMAKHIDRRNPVWTDEDFKRDQEYLDILRKNIDKNIPQKSA